MLTHCPKCQTNIDVDQYHATDLCAFCKYDLNIVRYKTVATLCVLSAALPWLGLLKFPYAEMRAAWIVTAVFLSAAAVEIGGDLLLRLAGLPKPRRRAIVGPAALIVPIVVAIGMPSLMAL